MRLAPLLMLGLLGCTAPGGTAFELPTPEPYVCVGDDDATDDDDVTDDAHPVFDPWTIHEITITLGDDAIDALRLEPRAWVEGTVRFNDEVMEHVGVRLKGSSSFQDVDHKPSWKLKMDEYVPGARLRGLERLTLNNEVWDPTMMAENMAYATFREMGAPAPRTGYALVTLDDRRLGIYAIIESMDDGFMEENWDPGEGGMWEMTRNCDFDGDCSCFEVQETGPANDPGGLVRGCEAVARSGIGALDEAFKRDEVLSFLAVERAVNHPDSYTYNGNNFFVHHDPLDDRLSLVPWGSDSTFIYAYPPNTRNPECQPLHKDVLSAAPRGVLTALCDADPTCSAELTERILDVADHMEDVDLVGRMEATRDMLDPYAPLEEWVNWNNADRARRVGCFLRWTEQRPEELRTRLGR
jgi:hypothetical protein